MLCYPSFQEPQLKLSPFTVNSKDIELCAKLIHELNCTKKGSFGKIYNFFEELRSTVILLFFRGFRYKEGQVQLLITGEYYIHTFIVMYSFC